MRPEKGFTLIETMLTAAIFCLIAGAFVKYLPSTQTFFRRVQLRQEVQSDAMSAMDTMTRFLRSGKASTVVICSCNQNVCNNTACNPLTADAPPNSQIDFTTQDGHARRFYWGSDNSLMMSDNSDPTNLANPPVVTPLAKNVASVTFSGNYQDLAIVNVDLFISAPLDNSGDSAHVMTLGMPTQSVRMLTTN